MELINKLKWIIDNGSDPRRSELHDYICNGPIDYDDFDCYWYFHRYETVYYSTLSEWILEAIWDENENKIYDDNKYDLNYIADLVDKMYKDGINGYWGFKCDW